MADIFPPKRSQDVEKSYDVTSCTKHVGKPSLHWAAGKCWSMVFNGPQIVMEEPWIRKMTKTTQKCLSMVFNGPKMLMEKLFTFKKKWWERIMVSNALLMVQPCINHFFLALKHNLFLKWCFNAKSTI